ncbi:MAG: phosphoadenylyl-sulfate reductase [Myxococcota bacterium]
MIRIVDEDSGKLAGWMAAMLGQANRHLDSAHPQEVIAWAVETFGDGLTLGTSFGVSGMALIDLALEIEPNLDIFYVDTGLFFEETYTLIARAEDHFGRGFRQVTPVQNIHEQALEHGDALWSSNPDQCCHLRKVVPLRQAVAGRTGWMTAVRRDQSPSRANTQVVRWNRSFQAVKLAPLAQWTERDVWRHVISRGVPYNSLHDQDYPSIGCAPCTRPVREGEDARAGRWSGRAKTECGIHLAS